MLPLQRVVTYLKGCIILAGGERDGIKEFDLSVSGFYQSFQAIGFALPFMALTWLTLSNSEQLAVSANAGPNGLFIFGFLIELSTWLAPLIVVFFAANLLGIADRITAYIVASNWTNLLFTLVSWPPSLMNLLSGRDPMEGTSAYQLTLFFVALIFSWRVQHAVLGKGALVTTGIFLFTFLISFIVLIGGQRILFGL